MNCPETDDSNQFCGIEDLNYADCGSLARARHGWRGDGASSQEQGAQSFESRSGNACSSKFNRTLGTETADDSLTVGKTAVGATNLSIARTMAGRRSAALNCLKH